MKTKFKKILYISHDGLLDPLGQSQILQYVNKLSVFYNFYLISLEKKNNLLDSRKLELLKNDLKNNNIEWNYFAYEEKSFLLKFINFSKILMLLIKLLIKQNIRIVHIRSYLPGFYVLPLKIFFKFKLIFDIRGFLPQEKIDRLNISYINYKIILLKIIESFLFRLSDDIITLTHQSKKIIKKKYRFSGNNIFVIPTCVDTNIFKPIKKNNDHLLIGYIGNISGAYNIMPIIKIFIKILKINKNSILNIYTNEDSKFLEKHIIESKILNKNYLIKSVDRYELAKIIPKFDIGIFNLKLKYSLTASFPTKIGEFLSSGVPIICNNFNEDIINYVNDNKIGLIVDFYDEIKNVTSFYNKVIKIKNDKQIISNCRLFSLNYLSVENACNKYKEIYEKYL